MQQIDIRIFKFNQTFYQLSSNNFMLQPVSLVVSKGCQNDDLTGFGSQNSPFKSFQVMFVTLRAAAAIAQ